MEKRIEVEQDHNDNWTTKISIDNSSDFKDFSIALTGIAPANAKSQTLKIQFSDSCLDIGEITLVGREIELLKEFLNQDFK